MVITCANAFVRYAVYVHLAVHRSAEVPSRLWIIRMYDIIIIVLRVVDHFLGAIMDPRMVYFFLKLHNITMHPY